jgi:hypothetical protein
MKTLLLLITLSGLLYAQNRLPGERDPWQWPFHEQSIWNMPIGSNAQYGPSDLRAAGAVGADIIHLYKLDRNDPLTPVLNSSWTNRCGNTQSMGYSLHFPRNWIIKDANSGSAYGNTPNSTFAFLDVDGETLIQGQLLARCVAGGPIHAPSYVDKRQKIKGDGWEYGGGSGASWLTALGGTIRKGALSSDEPIRHVLKILMNAKDFYAYGKGGPCEKGWRWPAKAADNYAAKSYWGSNNTVCMGSLLAIPPSVTEASLGLQNDAAKKLFWTLQNYGAYIVEDAAWSFNGFLMEEGVEHENGEFIYSQGTWKSDVNKLFTAMQVVLNNSPTNVGGGGTPRQPLAPLFIGQGGGTSSSNSMVSSSSVSPSSSSRSPFTGTLEAESADELSGLGTDGFRLRFSASNHWAKYIGINFGSAFNAVAITYSVPIADAGNWIELRTGGIDGAIAAEVKTQGSGGWDQWRTDTVSVSNLSGIQDLFITFRYGDGHNSWIADIDKMVFFERAEGPVSTHRIIANESKQSMQRIFAHPEKGLYVRIPGRGDYLLNGKPLKRF